MHRLLTRRLAALVLTTLLALSIAHGMFLTIRGAIIGQDIAVLEALVLEGVILVVVANFLVDAFQDRLDPRLRAGGGG